LCNFTQYFESLWVYYCTQLFLVKIFRRVIILDGTKLTAKNMASCGRVKKAYPYCTRYSTRFASILSKRKISLLTLAPWNITTGPFRPPSYRVKRIWNWKTCNTICYSIRQGFNKTIPKIAPTYGLRGNYLKNTSEGH
jgi:hypothetical protein